MTQEKILQAIKLYRNYFERNEIPNKEFPHNLVPLRPVDVLAHCHSMLDQMEAFVAKGDLEKTFRWLGFIQGSFWSLGIYPLEDLKNHNR